MNTRDKRIAIQKGTDPMIEQLRQRIHVARLSQSNVSLTPDQAQALVERIEQLQMPHTAVLKLAELDEGADTQAMLKALCNKVEAQRRELSILNDERGGSSAS